MILLGLLPGCALMTGRYESQAVRLEHATGRQVCDALEQVFGPTAYRCGMDRSVRDPDLPPNVGVDASGAPMIVVWVEGGSGDDLERALKIVRAVDDAASDEWGRRSGSDGGSIRTILPAQTEVPDGAATLVLLHADAREVARMLNEIGEASFWAAESRRGCVLRIPPVEFLDVVHDDPEMSLPPGAKWHAISKDDPEIARFIEESELQRLRDYLRDGPRSGPFQVEPPPPSFRAWDARTLVVLEAGRDDEYLPRVRELVARLDQPRSPQSDR